MTPTPEQRALARRIAKCIVPDDPNRPRGWIFRGQREVARDAALAAIIETSERAAKLADSLEGSDAYCLGETPTITDALRSGEHLKGDGR